MVLPLVPALDLAAAAAADRSRTAPPASSANAVVAKDADQLSWNPKSPTFTESRKPAIVASRKPVPAVATLLRRRTTIAAARANPEIACSRKSGPIVAMPE
jgi:hypothetical protein